MVLKTGSSRLVSAPSLKNYLLQREAIQLYRQTLKEIKLISEPKKRLESKQFARYQFDSVKHVTDTQHIKQLLKDGKWQLERFVTMVNMTR